MSDVGEVLVRFVFLMRVWCFHMSHQLANDAERWLGRKDETDLEADPIQNRWCWLFLVTAAVYTLCVHESPYYNRT
jgi:hypothetical protein